MCDEYFFGYDSAISFGRGDDLTIPWNTSHESNDVHDGRLSEVKISFEELLDNLQDISDLDEDSGLDQDDREKQAFFLSETESSFPSPNCISEFPSAYQTSESLNAPAFVMISEALQMTNDSNSCEQVQRNIPANTAVEKYSTDQFYGPDTSSKNVDPSHNVDMVLGNEIIVGDCCNSSEIDLNQIHLHTNLTSGHNFNTENYPSPGSSQKDVKNCMGNGYMPYQYTYPDDLSEYDCASFTDSCQFSHAYTQNAKVQDSCSTLAFDIFPNYFWSETSSNVTESVACFESNQISDTERHAQIFNETSSNSSSKCHDSTFDLMKASQLSPIPGDTKCAGQETEAPNLKRKEKWIKRQESSRRNEQENHHLSVKVGGNSHCVTVPGSNMSKFMVRDLMKMVGQGDQKSEYEIFLEYRENRRRIKEQKESRLAKQARIF